MPPVLGPKGLEDVRLDLDEHQLVRLARDLLVCRGHRGVRQTDGPGDGKRDVHSIARDGRRHLTQCKHHDDCEVACTSDELSELPVGLVKFGIPQGLFVTDARISPQAKREYLEDYRQLELEFLDAEELLAEVLSRSPLRALWFDGGKLGAINSRVTFPVIFRRHDTDRPVMPLRHVSLREGMFGVIRGEAAQLGLVAEARESASERAPFERYRLPTRLTMEEGSRSELQVTEIGFRGGMALHELEALAETLALALASSVSSGIGPVSVVVGRAFVTPLEGEDAGLRTLTDASRVTAVGINGSGLLESRWFKPDPEGKWDDTCDARVTEAGWVRLYHAAMNVAAACEVVTTAGPFDAVLRQTTRLGWTRSVFALLPAWKKWPRDDIPEPDDRIDWTYEPGQILCGWLHPLTGGTPIPVPSDHGDDESLPLFDERAADLALSDLRDRVATIANARLVEPERARHMLALVSRDPLAGDDEPTTFGTADVLAAFEGLASPIDPTSRRGELTVAWRADKPVDAELAVAAAALGAALNGTASVERADEFLAVTIRIDSLPAQISTPTWLEHIAATAAPILVSTEDRIKATGAPCIRATGDFWWKEHHVRLGVPWHASDKVYLWRAGKSGPEPLGDHPKAAKRDRLKTGQRS